MTRKPGYGAMKPMSNPWKWTTYLLKTGDWSLSFEASQMHPSPSHMLIQGLREVIPGYLSHHVVIAVACQRIRMLGNSGPVLLDRRFLTRLSPRPRVASYRPKRYSYTRSRSYCLLVLLLAAAFCCSCCCGASIRKWHSIIPRVPLHHPMGLSRTPLSTIASPFASDTLLASRTLAHVEYICFGSRDTQSVGSHTGPV